MTDTPPAGRLNWGILGTGDIARTFARGLARSRTGRLVAVGSRTPESAGRFGREFGVDAARCHGSYDALLADPRVRAVYVATPHPQHVEWAVKAADAKKHVLCEKPLGVNYAEAAVIVDAARRNDVFLMEAFMYRCHPQTRRLVELLRGRAIGDVRVIQATFSFHWPVPYDPRSRLLDPALAGGGILDVGCYCTSMARLIAGVAAGKDGPAEPIDVSGAAHLGPTGVDEWAVATLTFPGGVLAQLAAGVQVEQENVVRVYGSDGRIVVPEPWIPAKEGGATKILLYRRGEATPEEIAVDAGGDWLYSIEADTVAAHLDRRQAPFPAMTWDDTLGNVRTLDRWRHAVGVEYPGERFPLPCTQGRGRG